jgi:hypothetical protein
MALTINEIRRLRISLYREAKAKTKAIDTKVEALQRQIDRILSRKQKMPEMVDFMDTAKLLEEVDYQSGEMWNWLDLDVIPMLDEM